MRQKILRVILLLIVFGSSGFLIRELLIDAFQADARLWTPLIGVISAILFVATCAAEERWRATHDAE